MRGRHKGTSRISTLHADIACMAIDGNDISFPPPIRVMNDEATRPAIPAGFVDREGVCRMFGIASATLKRWERTGFIPRAQRPGGRWKLYPNHHDRCT